MNEFKQLVESLSDHDISKRLYDAAVEKINNQVNVIWRFICKTANRKLDWWAFSNDVSYGHGDGSSGGNFDPDNDDKFIEIIGDNSKFNAPHYEYNDGFPTELLWTDNWMEVVEAHTKRAKIFKSDEDNIKNRSAHRKEAISNLKDKLSSILSKEEMNLISFKNP